MDISYEIARSVSFLLLYDLLNVFFFQNEQYFNKTDTVVVNEVMCMRQTIITLLLM